MSPTIDWWKSFLNRTRQHPYLLRPLTKSHTLNLGLRLLLVPRRRFPPTALAFALLTIALAFALLAIAFKSEVLK